MKALFETPYRVVGADCDRYGIWRIDRILVLLQGLAGEHSALLGSGREDTLEHNAIWILTRTEIEVLDYPGIGQTVIGKTFPGPSRRGIFPRYYQVEDREGRVLVRGSSFWVLVDVDTRQMVDLPQVAALMPDTGDITPFFHNPAAASPLQSGREVSFSWKPLYTDIDQNGHVNNTRAADWALCLLGEQVDLKRHPVSNLAVSYHKELLPEDSVELEFRLDRLAFSLICRTGGEDALRLSGTLKENGTP